MVSDRRSRLIRWVRVLLAVVVLTPGGAAAAAAHSDPGRTTRGTVVSNGIVYQDVLYTPTSYHSGRPVPLVVVLHGCTTTAAQQMKASLYNPLAEREGFAVLYPDVDATGRALPGPANQCWKFPYPPAWTRGNSDAAAIADMTRAVMAKLDIDPQRVYLIGMSAGGLMASVEAAAYPDLYAAVGVVEAAGYTDWPCLTTGVGIPVTLTAQLAFEQMGPRARVVPIFVTGSDGDLAFPPNCANKALEQELRTDNLVISGSQDAPIALTPATVTQQQKPGGYRYAVSTYRDPYGCVIGEKWLIHGMPHAWPGGTTDPRYAGFTDPQAPSASDGSWTFFSRYRKSETSMPCAESAVPSTGPSPASAPRRCLTRWLPVRLPPGTRSISATVNGRRASVRKARDGARVRLPPTARGLTTVVVTARMRTGRRLSRRYVFRGCGRGT